MMRRTHNVVLRTYDGVSRKTVARRDECSGPSIRRRGDRGNQSSSVDRRCHRVHHFHIVTEDFFVHLAPEPQHEFGAIVERVLHRFDGVAWSAKSAASLHIKNAYV
jgi:hypothetical protein